MTDEPAPEGQPPPKKRRRRRRREPATGSQQPAGERSKRTSSKGKASRSRRSTTPVQREISAGGVVYRRDGDDIEVVLASRRTRRGDLAWGLAKGGIEPGESHEVAAVREVLEETGYTAEIQLDLTKLGYPAGLGDRFLFLGVDHYDGDSFVPYTDSYATRTWWFREREGECCPIWAYMAASPPT